LAESCTFVREKKASNSLPQVNKMICDYYAVSRTPQLCFKIQKFLTSAPNDPNLRRRRSELLRFQSLIRSSELLPRYPFNRSCKILRISRYTTALLIALPQGSRFLHSAAISAGIYQFWSNHRRTFAVSLQRFSLLDSAQPSRRAAPAALG
jgi:hypothetical protein